MDKYLREVFGREKWICEVCNETNEKPYCKCCGMIKRDFRQDAIGFSDELYKKGKTMVKNENEHLANEGLGYLEKAAVLGNVAAMKELGSLYENGYIASGGKSEAVKWYEKAAEAGDVESMETLGKLYFYSFFNLANFTPDYAKAKKWYKKAADAGSVEAIDYVGMSYENEGDYANAMKWYKKAAAAGNAHAVKNMGALYQNGRGVLQDYEKAMALYMEAAHDGDTDAMINIGLLYQEGYGVSQDYQKAIEWFEKAQAAGNRMAKGRINDLRNKASSCFITTAVCDSFGKPDDCYELTMFRRFRDTWLCKQEDGEGLIKDYYAVAPRIVFNINRLNNAKEVYRSIWTEYLKPCLLDLEADNKASCKKRYIRMVTDLKEIYLN